jgi:hypothetical protein
MGGIRGCPGCILCQKRLRLSLKVDECRPLPASMSVSSALLAAAGGAGRSERLIGSGEIMSCSSRHT